MKVKRYAYARDGEYHLLLAVDMQDAVERLPEGTVIKEVSLNRQFAALVDYASPDVRKAVFEGAKTLRDLDRSCPERRGKPANSRKKLTRRKPNQMAIGLTNRLLHNPGPNGAVVLEEGRGVMIYSLSDRGIRMEVISGDGLDTYYFDVPEHAILAMAEMVSGGQQ